VTTVAAPPRSPDDRLAAVQWDALVNTVDRDGYAVSEEPVLTPAECAGLRDGFTDDALFRSTVDMARHRFGEGRYRYYASPLPDLVGTLRKTAYPSLAGLANSWAERLGDHARYPARLKDFLATCRVAGQTKPTPLILRYETAGYNALHQDLYGKIAFPLQVTVALSQPGVDFMGGENLLVEQRPRAQSRGTSITVPLGHLLLFPTRFRPVEGSRGHYRTTVRHGVSTVRSGSRYALGVIFHDAA
jgi:hypothetical protein